MHIMCAKEVVRVPVAKEKYVVVADFVHSKISLTPLQTDRVVVVVQDGCASSSGRWGRRRRRKRRTVAVSNSLYVPGSEENARRHVQSVLVKRFPDPLLVARLKRSSFMLCSIYVVRVQ